MLSKCIVYAILAVVLAVAGKRRLLLALHLLQLDSYNNKRLLKWLLTLPTRRLIDLPLLLFQTAPLAIISVIIAALTVVSVPLSIQYADFVASVSAALLAGATFLYARRYPVEEQKKPLVFTGRAKRILGLSFVLLFAAWITSILISPIHITSAVTSPVNSPASIAIEEGSASYSWSYDYLCLLLLIQLAPFFTMLANFLLMPVQWGVNRYYLYLAAKKLRRIRPLIVGITGSYGKTSTKFFLGSLLSAKYKTLKSPASYNTPMGICRTINENLSDNDQLFLCEMGAYLPGNIRELCGIAPPKIGIITAVGPMHLERMKTIENIASTKYELIESLPADGAAIFNCDNERVAKLADRTTHVKVWRYGTAENSEQAAIRKLDLWASDVHHSAAGLHFTINQSSYSNQHTNNESRPVVAPVLGKHNVGNLLASSCVALQLGMKIDETVAGIASVESAPHRLQLIKGDAGVTVIDDSYNSNPEGSAAAVEVLGQMGDGRKVLVTPGMVELGHLSDAANEEFGRKAATVCSLVILVGAEQTKPIRRGLESSGFPATQIVTVETLTEAQSELGKFLRPGDAVLFENDLPDLYSRKS